MFKLISKIHEEKLTGIVEKITICDFSEIVHDLQNSTEQIHQDIPEKKRISYGRYNIIKNIGIFMYPFLEKSERDILQFASKLVDYESNDPFITSLGVQIYSIYGEKSGELDIVVPLFENIATNDNWIVRECSTGFFRKLIKSFPDKIHSWYKKMVQSKHPMKRRFAIESLRPVVENHWLKKNPEYAFSILELMYKENSEYPRTSVGNSLSDWMRIDEKRTLDVVKKLADNGNKDSYWIAYRACRNLVKKDVELVMDILKIDRYKYKDRKFDRNDIT
jgi:3-methyladenine DNA glycosylase AlkC